MYIFIAIYVYIAMYISHLLYPSINCFHILAMVDNAVVNTEVHVSFFFFFCIYLFEPLCSFSLDKPRSEIAGLYGSSIFMFLGISILFSIATVPIYISTISAPVPFSSTTDLLSFC